MYNKIYKEIEEMKTTGTMSVERCKKLNRLMKEVGIIPYDWDLRFSLLAVEFFFRKVA